MKNSLAAFFFFVCILPNSFADNKGTLEKTTIEKTTIEKTLADQVSSWNKGDLDGFMAAYWKSDDLCFYSGGSVSKGWQALKDRYQARYFDKEKGKERGSLTFSDIQVEMLGDQAAYIRGKWKVVDSKETNEGLYTLIMKKLDGQWKIVHDHTSK